MNQVDLRQYWRSLRANWWLAVLGVVLGGAVAAAVTYTTTPQYQTQMRMYVSTNTGDPVLGSQFAQAQMATYAAYLTDQQVMATAIGELGLDTTPARLAEQVTVTIPPGTTFLDVTVTDPSPRRALDIALSLSDSYPDLVAALETPEDAVTSLVRVRLTAVPVLPTDPVSPDPVTDMGIGLLLGLVVGVTVAVLRDRLDTRVRADTDAAVAAGAPFLGAVPRDREVREHKLVRPRGRSVAAEQFRQLRTNLDVVDGHPPAVVVVSSALLEEGKTTVAVNLARALAEAGRSVLLVDGDLRRPRVSRYLGLAEGTGLTQVLRGSVSLADAVRPGGEAGLVVLGAGPLPPDPGELLVSRRMADVVAEARSRYDVVVVDAPPVLAVADARVLATLADGVLLCVRWGSTRVARLREARTALDRSGARTVGVVGTMVPAAVVRHARRGLPSDPAPVGGSAVDSPPARAPRPPADLPGAPAEATGPR